MSAISRRQFNAAMAALGVSAASSAQPRLEAQHLLLTRNGWMPNNGQLPVLHYHRAFAPQDAALADHMERTFAHTGWPAQWRNGVYPFHHFHSTAHEVLGFAGGSAAIILGGEGGEVATVEAGDVLVLPTGTGHCLQHASADFLVVGAYPAGQHWDICRTVPDTAAIDRMRTLPFPATDPISGPHGPLLTAWHH